MEKGAVIKFYTDNKDKFKSKRQASKYLNGFGLVWKTEHGTDLQEARRGGVTVTPRTKSDKNLRRGKKK